MQILWKISFFLVLVYGLKNIGNFGANTTYYEYTTKTCLEDSILKDLEIPIIYDADISHKPPSMTIINGSIAHVICDKGKSKISFELK